VDAGWLTPQQAAMRGKRDVFARQLVERHGISRDQALRVADNEIPLLDAVRQASPQERIEIAVDAPRRPVRRFVVVAGVLVAVAASAVFVVLSSRDDPGARLVSSRSDAMQRGEGPASVQPGTDLRFDVEGRLTEVSGGHPESVLRAYCDTLDGDSIEPVELRADGNDWKGLYRRKGELYAIQIRRDPERELWVAGNGTDWLRGRILREP
jgi:hypothetical protein